jgi:hypothetical protein
MERYGGGSIVVSDYNPAWSATFEQERTSLHTALGPLKKAESTTECDSKLAPHRRNCLAIAECRGMPERAISAAGHLSTGRQLSRAQIGPGVRHGPPPWAGFRSGRSG